MNNNCETTDSLESLFLSILNNCIYYEKMQHLLNEIGVLRGIGYAIYQTGNCPHTPEYLHFIEIQNQLLKIEKNISL